MSFDNAFALLRQTSSMHSNQAFEQNLKSLYCGKGESIEYHEPYEGKTGYDTYLKGDFKAEIISHRMDNEVLPKIVEKMKLLGLVEIVSESTKGDFYATNGGARGIGTIHIIFTNHRALTIFKDSVQNDINSREKEFKEDSQVKPVKVEDEKPAYDKYRNQQIMQSIEAYRKQQPDFPNQSNERFEETNNSNHTNVRANYNRGVQSPLDVELVWK